VKRYDENSECPKCGYGKRVADRCPPEDEWYPARLGEQEHIRRRCSRCGYVWHEKPLDAEEE